VGFFGERQAPRSKVSPLKEMNALSRATPIFLTPPQKRLLSEVSNVAELFRLDHVNILDYDPEERTARSLNFGRRRSSRLLIITYWKSSACRRKLRLVKAIIEPLNAVRNGLTHAFFPENLRSSKPIWNGKDIFTTRRAYPVHRGYEQDIGLFLASQL
jgi:hypothetical protein